MSGRSLRQRRGRPFSFAPASGGAAADGRASDRFTAVPQLRQNLFAAGDLRVRRVEPLLPLAGGDEFPGGREGAIQLPVAAQGAVEEGVAEIGPGGAVAAAEGGLVRRRRGDDEGPRIGKRVGEDAGVAGRNDEHPVACAGRVEEPPHVPRPGIWLRPATRPMPSGPPWEVRTRTTTSSAGSMAPATAFAAA